MEKQENLHKELDLIQHIITRMSSNSFLIKGWTVTLISGLSIIGKDLIVGIPNGTYFIFFIMLVVLPFWWLDAFFLHREKMFRKLYQKVIKDPDAVNRVRYDLDPHVEKAYVKSIGKTMISKFLFWYYGPIMFMVLATLILKYFKFF